MQNPMVFRTTDDFSALLLRASLGVVMLVHGANKVLPEGFGGIGHEAAIESLEKAGLPTLIAWLVLLTELFGGLCLVIGFLTRVAAIGIGCVMVGAVLLVHLENGFFMDWANKKGAEGYEYHILAIAICVVLAFKGGGRWSVDGSIRHQGP